MTNRQLFLQHIAQTSPAPIGLEIVRAFGIHMWNTEGKKFTDLIAGFSVCNVGHSHPQVVAAVKDQVDKYMHLIVYGEFIEAPQVAYAQLLTSLLPVQLQSVYFTNSGAEATEGAMKVAKRFTGRTKIVACNNAYHGSTQGALSAMGNEYFKNAFRPLLPEVYHFNYNSAALIDAIDTTTACVIMETVQAESGINKPQQEWITAVRNRCTATGTLLILDEIQAGFGRTGSLWAFEQYGIVPDILLLGKALGGGMPLGAFIASPGIMNTLTADPVLGHITTFGGHPVSCAAGKAALQVLLQGNYISQVAEKEQYLTQSFSNIKNTRLRTAGLWAALEFDSFDTNKKVIDICLEKGLITDWFLFAPQCLRIAPPLTITTCELQEVINLLTGAVQQVVG